MYSSPPPSPTGPDSSWKRCSNHNRPREQRRQDRRKAGPAACSEPPLGAGKRRNRCPPKEHIPHHRRRDQWGRDGFAPLSFHQRGAEDAIVPNLLGAPQWFTWSVFFDFMACQYCRFPLAVARLWGPGQRSTLKWCPYSGGTCASAMCIKAGQSCGLTEQRMPLCRFLQWSAV